MRQYIAYFKDDVIMVYQHGAIRAVFAACDYFGCSTDELFLISHIKLTNHANNR